VRIAALVALSSLAGCHALFGLDEVRDVPPGDSGADGAIDDGKGPCGPRDTVVTTKLIGPRAGGMSPTAITDTFISSDTAHIASNFGALDMLFACNKCTCAQDCESIAGGDDDVVTLLKVDLSADVPSCSEVMFAQLVIDTTDDNLGAGSDVAVYPLLEAWDEGNGAVAAGTTGAASWQARAGANLWRTAGAGVGGTSGDSRSTTAMATFDPNADNTTFTVLLEKTVVQGWVDNPATNHGMAILVINNPSDVHFWSTEAVDSDRPALQIAYFAPL
jgi:hypothetical protein